MERAGRLPEIDVDQRGYPEVPETIPRHAGNGRPKIRHADEPTKMSYWVRASAAGDDMTNRFLLHRAEKRTIVYGISRDEALYLSAQAVAGRETDADKRELERIAAAAYVAGGGESRAAKGTAMHVLEMRRVRGDDLSHVIPTARAALAKHAELMDGFTIHGQEQFVVCDRWRSAGSYDTLLSPKWECVAPDGEIFGPTSRLVGDLKTGNWGVEWFGPGYIVQLTTYPNSVPYVHVDDEAAEQGDNGRREWPDGIAPSTTWAIIPHVPLESPEDAGLWWVDLTAGAELAELGVRNREAERLARDGFHPMEIPRPGMVAAPVAPVVAPEAPALDEVGRRRRLDVMRWVAQVPDQAALTSLWESYRDVWTPEVTELAKLRLRELGLSA